MGWPEKKIDELLILKHDKTKADSQTSLPYLPIDLIPTKSLALDSVLPGAEAKSSLQLFQKNDILIGAMRVYFHRVTIAPFNGITRNTCFVLSPKDENQLYYLLIYCFQDSTISYAQRTSKGSTMPYAVWEGGLGNMMVKIPPNDILNAYNTLAKPMIETIHKVFFENTALRNLRDSLLSKLLSGEIEVR